MSYRCEPSRNENSRFHGDGRKQPAGECVSAGVELLQPQWHTHTHSSNTGHNFHHPARWEDAGGHVVQWWRGQMNNKQEGSVQIKLIGCELNVDLHPPLRSSASFTSCSDYFLSNDNPATQDVFVIRWRMMGKLSSFSGQLTVKKQFSGNYVSRSLKLIWRNICQNLNCSH